MVHTKTRLDADHRTQELFRALATDIRHLREDAGVSQAALAREAGISQGLLSIVEAGKVRPTVETLSAIAAALGADLSVRLYPNTGPAIRDRFQARMVEALLGTLHPRWRPFVEVAVHRPVRGSIDVVLGDPKAGLLVATEIESDLRRLEQEIRWAMDKAAALANTELAAFAGAAVGAPPTISRLLVLRSTRSTRSIARTYERTLAAAYPARTVDILGALTGRQPDWPGGGILWASIDGRRTTILDGPPRGVALGR